MNTIDSIPELRLAIQKEQAKFNESEFKLLMRKMNDYSIMYDRLLEKEESHSGEYNGELIMYDKGTKTLTVIDTNENIHTTVGNCNERFIFTETGDYFGISIKTKSGNSTKEVGFATPTEGRGDDIFRKVN